MILGIGIRANKTVFIQPGKRPDGHGSKHIFKISYDKEK